MELSQLCAANYHYKRYTLDYFLESACLLYTSDAADEL